MKNFFSSFYLSNRIFILLSGNVILFVLGNFFAFFFVLGRYFLLGLLILMLLDLLLLFANKKERIAGKRLLPEKLSNGDKNPVAIYIKNNFPFPVYMEIIDEIPFRFQKRDFMIKSFAKGGEEKQFEYHLRPTQRGEYEFGKLNIFIYSPIHFVCRKYVCASPAMVPVYPSFMQLKRYELLAVHDKLTEAGIKKIRKVGHQLEFDHIRKYVKGDDYRTINWRATARRTEVMVNQFEDEKSQQVFSVIDMGRVMKMPFDGMALIDYAINASLVMANISMIKHDKAGLITFSDKIHSYLYPDKNKAHIHRFLELLYNQETDFAESSYELLYTFARKKISQRSLLMIYTNFESMSSMSRQLDYFKRLSRHYVVVVIFFKNTGIRDLIDRPVKSVEDIYIKTIAEKFDFEKKLIVREFKKYGIYSILTEPANLTVNAINKYLELKSMGAI